MEDEKRQYISVENYKSSLLVRDIVNGVERKYKTKFSPSIFVASEEKTDYMNFYQTGYVREITFKTGYDMNNYIKENIDIENYLWGSTNIVSQFINFQNYNCQDYHNIIISYLDIEVCTRYQKDDGTWVDGGFPNADEARFPINAICDYRSNDKKYHVFTTAEGWTPEKSKLLYKDQIVYVYCKNETDLIKRWIDFWKSNYPHIVTGWNNLTFDMPYIINRINYLAGNAEEANILSPWGIIAEKKLKSSFSKDINVYKIYGIATLDYLDLYKKYRYKTREKYTLQFISSIENPNDHKLEFEETTHGELYYNDPVFFVDYNIQDVRCVVCFERDLQFINLACFISYYAGVNFEENMSPVKVWSNLIYNDSLSKHIVVPIKEKKEIISQPFEGAYVHDVEPGLKGAIISLDFSSLYPNIMRGWYISPDTHQTGINKKRLYNGLIETLENDTNPKAKEMLDEIKKTGIFNQFYINNDIPESVTKYIKENGVSLTSNCEFYKITIDSVVVGLISDLFTKRKSDKKQSFNHTHNYQNIAKELEKRGIKVDE